MEREVGGGIGMGNTCKPMAVSFQCMTKFTTKKKKKDTGKKKMRGLVSSLRLGYLQSSDDYKSRFSGQEQAGKATQNRNAGS